MTDFTTNIDMNVRMMNEKLRVDKNFDILQRDVLIGGKRTHFYFIDGFVQEETIEKLVQFFYSLKESDIKDIDTFLEVGMPYTEIEKKRTLRRGGEGISFRTDSHDNRWF